MDILSNAKRHASEINRTLRVVEVPEWGDDKDNPAIVYVKPLNMEQKAEILDAINEGGIADSMFLQVFHMCRDKDGSRTFARGDRDVLLRDVDADVLQSLIANLKSELSREEITKN